MRIVKRKEFLALPENTLYAEYESYVFGDLMVKGEVVAGNDWVELSIVDAIDLDELGDYMEKLDMACYVPGTSIDMDFNAGGRNGCFESDEGLFAIFEKKDIDGLILKLSDCIHD